MTPKKAVAVAKLHLGDTFAGEMDYSPRLEELWFDEVTNDWCVTLTIWRKNPTGNPLLFGPTELKVVRIRDADGKAMSIRNREPSAA
jgi:hypothetical protein